MYLKKERREKGKRQDWLSTDRQTDQNRVTPTLATPARTISPSPSPIIKVVAELFLVVEEGPPVTAALDKTTSTHWYKGVSSSFAKRKILKVAFDPSVNPATPLRFRAGDSKLPSLTVIFESVVEKSESTGS